MANENVVKVNFPKKRKPPKIKPLFLVVGIIVIILVVWAVFFRPASKQEETQPETDKQEEATASAEPKEATSSAETTSENVDTSNWYEYTDVEKTFSIKVPKGWFFDKTLKGPREQGSVLGGVANLDLTKKDFDPKKNSAVYFELDSKDSGITLQDHATKIACVRTNDVASTDESCQDPTEPESQKTMKVGSKEAIWQEIHGLAGLGIEVYIQKSNTEIFVVYSEGRVEKTNEGFKVNQELANIVEAMLPTFKFL
jgi:hypothetical protein